MSGEQVGVRSGDRAIETGRPESTCRLPLGTVLFAVTLLFGITGSASPVSAQAPAAAQPGVQPGGTAALPVAVARQTGQFPNSPFPFARGDDQGGSNVGFYFS